MEAFDADIQQLPQWVQYWVNFLGAVIVMSTLAFLVKKETRLLGLAMIVSMILVIPSMIWLHGQMGMVRLLGLVHVVFWTPLVIYMWKVLRTAELGRLYTAIVWITLITLCISLAFDFADVARWLLGERGSIVGAA